MLPVAQAVAVHAALARAAATARANGDPRSTGQLMADTLVALVTGQQAATDIPIEVQVIITDRALLAGDDTPAHVPGYGPVPAAWLRHLLTPDDEADETDQAGRSDTGDQGGICDLDRGQDDSPVPEHAGSERPEPAQDPRPPDRPPRAASMRQSRRARTWLRRLYTHPSTGTLVAMDSRRRLFDAGLRRYLITRDGLCRTPWCNSPIRHLDHIHPHGDGGPTTATNGQGLCIRCNPVKDLPGWRAEVLHPGPTTDSDTDSDTDMDTDTDTVHPHTVRLTTPTGHTYTSTAPPVLPGLTAPGSGRQPRPGPSTDAGRPTAVVIELHSRGPSPYVYDFKHRHLAS